MITRFTDLMGQDN